jgi:hypothetical protein
MAGITKSGTAQKPILQYDCCNIDGPVGES